MYLAFRTAAFPYARRAGSGPGAAGSGITGGVPPAGRLLLRPRSGGGRSVSGYYRRKFWGKSCRPSHTRYPFAGSGSTGVVAAAAGHPFIGIETTNHYAQIARQRLTDATMQHTPGRVVDAVPPVTSRPTPTCNASAPICRTGVASSVPIDAR